MMIVNDDSRVVTKLVTSLTGDARVIIYDRHMFIVQAIVRAQPSGEKCYDKRSSLLCHVIISQLSNVLQTP